MENQDKKPNIIAIIGAIVLLVLAVVGLSYAFFSAFIKNGETDPSIEGTGANLSLVYTDGKSVITSSNIMPGWSATKTFTVTNNGEADTYYKLNISNITNEFVEGGLTFSIASADGGTSVAEQAVGTTTRTISPSITIAEGATHTYTITAKYVNLDKDQTPDLGKSFSYTIGIEASTIPAPEGWLEAKKGTLLALLRDNNKVQTPLTIPGKEVSAHVLDDVESQTTSVSSTYQAYYITYGTGWTANGSNFNLTGTAVTSDTYANSYSSLVGKYLPDSFLYRAGSSTVGTMVTTTNLSSVYYVVSATSSSFVYKQITSNKNTTEALLASTDDDYGTTYYFRGAVKNNYVQFANKCWRIVRITGDGSVKLVLHNDNISSSSNPCSSANNSTTAAFARYSGTRYRSAFNSSANDNAYIGLMYGTTGASDYASTHANTNKSTILTNLETWYTNNLASYESKLADTIWCNDKSTFTTYTSGSTYGTGLGYGTNVTGYGADNRIYGDGVTTYVSPSLICSNDNNGGKLSKFTVSDTANGNGNLAYKIGLLMADEIAFAGYANSSYNSVNYLQENATGASWWSLSPNSFNYGYAYGWCGGGSLGVLSPHGVSEDYYGVRPAISLVSNIEISGGTGTSEDPYIVK